MQTARKYWRRKDYTGSYTGAVKPASWQENMDSLQAGLQAAQLTGNACRIAAAERGIQSLQAIDPETYDRQFGLR